MRDEVPFVLFIRSASVHDTKGHDGVPPHHLPHDRIHVWQLITVSESREAALSNNGVQLGLCPALYFRVQRACYKQCLH